MQALTLLVGLSFKDANNLSVFPLAPVEILWIIMITSSFPAMGLGAEVASPDILNRKPHNVSRSKPCSPNRELIETDLNQLKVGIFTRETLVDIAVIGCFGAASCLATFTFVVFAIGDGNLGRELLLTASQSRTRAHHLFPPSSRQQQLYRPGIRARLPCSLGHFL